MEILQHYIQDLGLQEHRFSSKSPNTLGRKVQSSSVVVVLLLLISTFKTYTIVVLSFSVGN